MKEFIDNLFQVVLELDGSLNGLNSETIQLQYMLVITFADDGFNLPLDEGKW